MKVLTIDSRDWAIPYLFSNITPLLGGQRRGINVSAKYELHSASCCCAVGIPIIRFVGGGGCGCLAAQSFSICCCVGLFPRFFHSWVGTSPQSLTNSLFLFSLSCCHQTIRLSLHLHRLVSCNLISSPNPTWRILQHNHTFLLSLHLYR